MTRDISIIHLSQYEPITPTTSAQYSASLCWDLNTKVDIKGEKGFFGNPD
jgi:hypothetical protein